jgi:small subunit ribosomal protein S23
LIRAPPVTFPRTDGKVKKIEMPEDVYVKRFFKKHPDSLYHDAVK